MTGYFTEPHKYEGAYEAGEQLYNGQFVELVTANSATTVKKLTSKASGVIMRVEEKTELFGNPAVRVLVLDGGAAGVYMAENEFDVGGDANYDTSDYSVAAGELVKMGLVARGDKMIFNVTSEVAATLAVGDSVSPTSAGTIVKNS